MYYKKILICNMVCGNLNISITFLNCNNDIVIDISLLVVRLNEKEQDFASGR